MKKKLLSKRVIISFCIIITIVISVSFTTFYMNAAPSYNYGEAMQKGLMFYEFQRAGILPDDKRDNWRGDSGLDDGADNKIDLTGGWYDAGDHVKFNLPMSYTSTMLAWSVYEDEAAYKTSGQLDYALDNIKWANDYFIKCHPSANEYYYQVGDGGLDHAWWGPAEVMQMERPSYKVTVSSPGSTVVAETAASLASAAIVFKEIDSDYSKKCLTHAKELYNFAETTLSDKGYTAANGFYQSWSGWYDELSWAGAWLYMATDDPVYLEKAEKYVSKWGTEPQTTTIAYKWAHCWDDVHYGAQLLLARLTDKDLYKESVERSLDYWSGISSEKITYTPKGLAWMDTWGSLRYATTMGFLADVYADYSGCSASKIDPYKDFAKAQIDYALGSTGRSFVVGFGANPPEKPHHRTAHSSWADSQTVPEEHRHSLIGALVGGPDASDNYTDDISNYTTNEVACDYNAGFVGLCTRMYDKYGGTPISSLSAIEDITNDEFFVEAGINASGSNFLEIKALLNNRSGWPARVGDKLSFKYFFDITEFIEEGYSSSDITIVTNYNNGAKVSDPIKCSGNIYYVNVDFTGTKIYPGGQSAYKKEVQFRISAPQNTSFWDSTNDYSFKDIEGVSSGNTIKTEYMPVYDDGRLVYGVEPDCSISTETPVTSESPETPTESSKITEIPTVNPTPTIATETALENEFDIIYDIQNEWSTGATVNVTIKNNGTEDINSWSLGWAFSGNQEIINLWSAEYEQNGVDVLVKNAVWNSFIAAGSSISFGFNISFTGENEIPDNFQLN